MRVMRRSRSADDCSEPSSTSTPSAAKRRLRLGQTSVASGPHLEPPPAATRPLGRKDRLVELLLQHLVDKVDAELLKRVCLQLLEAENVEDACSDARHGLPDRVTLARRRAVLRLPIELERGLAERETALIRPTTQSKRAAKMDLQSASRQICAALIE